jgi:hypothetical protein
MSLLNLFQTTLYTTCFDHHWSSWGVLKLFLKTAVVLFCASNVWCVVPLHIHVFCLAGCLLLLYCVFKYVWLFDIVLYKRKHHISPVLLCCRYITCVFEVGLLYIFNGQHFFIIILLLFSTCFVVYITYFWLFIILSWVSDQTLCSDW